MELAELNDRIERAPFDEKLRVREIAICLAQGMLPEAVAALSEKARLCGLKPQDGKLIIELYMRLQGADASKGLLKELASHELVRTTVSDIEVANDADAQSTCAAVEKLQRYGVYDHAQKLLDAALARFPVDAHVHSTRIRFYFDQLQYTEAVVAANAKHLACRLDDTDALLLSKLYSVIVDSGLRNDEIVAFLANSFVQQSVANTAAYAGFESLGDDCELGFVQRKLGQEPLGLLRFAGLPFETLIDLLNNDFQNFALPENCRLSMVKMGEQTQYDLYDSVYKYQIHTFILVDPDGDVGPVLSKFCARVQFLKRKLLDDLASGEKIFVYKSGNSSDDDAYKLSQALLRHGQNRLLFVREFDPKQSVKHAALVRKDEYLLYGYVKRFDIHVRLPSHVLEWQSLLNGAAREFAMTPVNA